MLIAFLFSLLIFVVIGLSSAKLSRGDKRDYYLASNSVSPALVGLSAVATNNSGYMFVGLIGYVYTEGLAAVWLMVGWILGDFIAARRVHGQLRAATERTGEVSYAGVLSAWQSEPRVRLQKLMAAIAMVFLLAYAAAQLVAGAKALHVLLQWPLWSGAVLGSVLVIAYCVAGGIRASIWTDAAQSIVMISAMVILLMVAISDFGGPAQAQSAMAEIDGYLDIFPSDQLIPGVSGLVLFIFGWAVAGFSVIGQPHVMVRFMTLANNQGESAMIRARVWYYGWFIGFWLMATLVGMMARLYLPGGEHFDAELALPTLAAQLLPEAFVGLILAGLFAATLSTADSLVLSCSATLSHDLFSKRWEKPAQLKAITALVTLAALAWALVNSASVFNLVILAWSGLGSAFGPLLLIQALGAKPSENTAMGMVIAGFSGALLWRYLGLSGAIYEGVFAMVLSFGIWLLLDKCLKK